VPEKLLHKSEVAVRLSPLPAAPSRRIGTVEDRLSGMEFCCCFVGRIWLVFPQQWGKVQKAKEEKQEVKSLDDRIENCFSQGFEYSSASALQPH